VTIHRTTPELDAGPIAAQAAFPVEPDDDAGAVYGRAASRAVELLDEVLARYPAVELRPQPEAGVTYAAKIEAPDRELDWEAPAEEIVNRVRALSPHIGARAQVRGRSLTVWKARPAEAGAVLVEGGVELLDVQPDGGRRMTGAEFLRGLRP
jgi:methionyl-tRNA formyltransferase